MTNTNIQLINIYLNLNIKLKIYQVVFTIIGLKKDIFNYVYKI